ncbi:choice-of-anchor R domain-containing protein [Adhaeretor mobilis]|uniref:PEP-CTERM protein-sorting domain-containing protein n=1 Tax=Adhaeretor mobilis TaxID=1930276 RepID=A0A517MS03_9BACT|nr:choice-of-anchor R domain-containing protein [Adhaeretor mobilis]QDS97662.1 hypothetical protein HG15A2_09260 [Adhaeretor mobilis]
MNFRLLIVACLTHAWSATSYAAVTFSTFGPGGAYDSLNGSIIEGPSSPFPQIIAEQFSPSTSVLLDGVDLAIANSAGTAEIGVSVYADSGGVPGAVLESVGMASFIDGVVTAPFSGNVQLDVGSTYWLAVDTGGANVQMWLDTTPTVFGTQSVSEDDGVSWFSYNTDPFSRAAFVVDGTPVGPADPPDIPLINAGEAWRYFKGLAEPSTGLEWSGQTFSDSTWNFGNGGFGYDTDLATQAGLLSSVGTELSDMRDDGVNQNAYTTLYLRRNFSVVNPFEISELVLELDYDDAFIAYVNAVEVARSSFGTVGLPEPFDGLGADHESTNGAPGHILERYVIDLTNDFPDLLQAGSENVLAIHGLNTSIDDADFVLSQISLGGNVSLAAGADFNGDGYVDATDLSVWATAFGIDNGGDADSDGDSDGKDFIVWQRQFTGSAVVGGVAVPEPASLGLFCAAVLSMQSGRPARRRCQSRLPSCQEQ